MSGHAYDHVARAAKEAPDGQLFAINATAGTSGRVHLVMARRLDPAVFDYLRTVTRGTLAAGVQAGALQVSSALDETGRSTMILGAVHGLRGRVRVKKQVPAIHRIRAGVR
jgi:hypothetical protein